jgi:hypothetical protein
MCDSKEKAEVIAAVAGVTLREIVSIDYSWGEIDFVTRPINEMMLKCCDASVGSAEPNGYDIDIEADDIDMADTVTIVWNIA